MCPVESLTLPQISFVAGSTQDLAFRVFSDTGEPLDLEDCTAEFRVAYYLDGGSTSVLSKVMTITEETAGASIYILRVVIPSGDTLGLCGKYIYQISLRDNTLRTEARQGYMIVQRNIGANTGGA